MTLIGQRIAIDEAVRFGKPVIAGTRLPVDTLLGRLAVGTSPEVLMQEYELTEPDLRLARELLEIFHRFDVAKLSIFGSALRPDFRPDSDLDLLVEFRPAAKVGLLTLARLRTAFEQVFGRPVDVIPATGLKPSLRRGIEESAKVLYAA